MTATALFIARLRTLGVSLRPDGTRLIVDAPRGVLTSELREQMGCLKQDMLSELEAEALAVYDTPARNALREIGAFFATAYRRSKNLRPVEEISGQDGGDDELAYSSRESVHGVVP
jgi:hypothetical protein